MEEEWIDDSEINPDDETLNEEQQQDNKTTTINQKVKGKKRKLSYDDTVDTCEKNTIKVRRKRLLKKNERADLVKSIKEMEINEGVKVQLRIDSQNIEGLTNVVDELVEDASLFQSIVNHHHKTFISLYDENSVGKDKYLTNGINNAAYFYYQRTVVLKKLPLM